MVIDNKADGREPSSERFALYRIGINNELHECIGQYNTVEEVWAQKRHIDWHYKVKVDGQFLTLAEFSQWAKKRF